MSHARRAGSGGGSSAEAAPNASATRSADREPVRNHRRMRPRTAPRAAPRPVAARPLARQSESRAAESASMSPISEHVVGEPDEPLVHQVAERAVRVGQREPRLAGQRAERGLDAAAAALALHVAHQHAHDRGAACRRRRAPRAAARDGSCAPPGAGSRGSRSPAARRTSSSKVRRVQLERRACRPPRRPAPCAARPSSTDISPKNSPGPCREITRWPLSALRISSTCPPG